MGTTMRCIFCWRQFTTQKHRTEHMKKCKGWT